MFLGKHHTTIDNQNLLAPPPKHSDLFMQVAFLTQGFDKNLILLTEEAFREIMAHIKTLNIADPITRLLLRLILGNTVEVQTDKTGQLVIPEDLRMFAGLTNEVLLIGQGDYFEIWSPESWRKQELRISDVEANSNRFSVLNIATSQ
jgi:MraZ protein